MSNTKLPGVRALFPEMFADSRKQNVRRRSTDDHSSSTNESPFSSASCSPILDGSRRLASPKHTRLPDWRDPSSFDSHTSGDFSFAPHDHSFDNTAFLISPKKKYLCNVCQRRFERPSSLDTHMNSHTGARPHVCPHPGCTKAFTTRSNMQRHFRSHDTEVPPWGSM